MPTKRNTTNSRTYVSEKRRHYSQIGSSNGNNSVDDVANSRTGKYGGNKPNNTGKGSR